MVRQRSRRWGDGGGGPLLLRVVALLLVGLAAPAPGPPHAQALVADLSQHLIAITTAFAGTEVLLFGATEGAGDIVVTVRGPETEQVVRRKERLLGIWLNLDRVTFRNVPAYYAVAASRPPEAIARPDVLARHAIGVSRLNLRPMDAAGRPEEEIEAFRAALIRNKQEQGLYTDEPAPVRFLGPRLFRTSLRFPANVPPGHYRVQTFLLRDGQVTGAQSSLLLISKVGLEAEIYDFARQQASLYGAVAVLISVVSGYLAGLVFRKD